MFSFTFTDTAMFSSPLRRTVATTPATTTPTNDGMPSLVPHDGTDAAAKASPGRSNLHMHGYCPTPTFTVSPGVLAHHSPEEVRVARKRKAECLSGAARHVAAAREMEVLVQTHMLEVAHLNEKIVEARHNAHILEYMAAHGLAFEVGAE